MIIDEKKALSCCKNSNALLRGITSNHNRYFYCMALTAFTHLEQKINLRSMRMMQKS